MFDVKIIGIATYLPGKPIDNKTLAKVIHANEEWIDFFVGTKTRHFCIDIHTGERLFNLSDICVEAARSAIVNSQIMPTEIEAIVMGTATPDNLMPATVNLVADKLGLNNIATYELQSGCTGAIQALDFGMQLLKSGKFKTVLVIGGDVCNKFLNLKQDFGALSSNELINYVLFGDGAGALVLKSGSEIGIRIGAIINRFTGLDRAPGQIINWFGVDAPSLRSEKAIFEDYKAIERNVPFMAKDLLEELLECMHCKQDEVDHFLMPQLGKIMSDKIVKQLAIDPERAINCVEYTGNNGNALPFIQLERLSKEIKPGKKAILVAIESSKWIKAGVTLYA